MDNFTNDSSGWNELAPALDEAIEKLDGPDRAAIVLRFFERADLRTIGAALGTSEDAAQKRVSRALEKLRILLQAHGVALSIAGLTTILASKSVSAAPPGWAAEISSKALATTPAEAGAIASVLALWALPAAKVAMVVLLVAAAVAAYTMQTHSSRNAANWEALNNSGISPAGVDVPGAAERRADSVTNTEPPRASVLENSNRLTLDLVDSRHRKTNSQCAY